MKILHIVESAQGVERYLRMLLPLLEDNYEQHLLCSMKFDCQIFENVVDSVVQIDMRRSISPLKIGTSISKIRTEIKKKNPDIIYCHSSFGGVLGRIAAAGLHHKIVYNPHGWAFNMK